MDKSNGMNDLRLSPTSIATYFQCQRKFFHRVIEKKPEKTSPAMIRGKIIHKVLDKFFGKVDLLKMTDKKWRDIWEELRKTILSVFEDEWNQIGKTKEYEDCFESEEQKKSMHNESEEFLDFFVAKLAYSLSQKVRDLDRKSEWFEANIKRHFYPKDRETEIELEEENVRGVMDKTIGLADRGVAIVDYKTSKTNLPHFIEGSDLKQAKVYAYMWKMKFGVLPKFISIFYIKDGESVYYPITERDFEEIKKDIREIRSKEAIKHQFPKHVTGLCKYCSFFNLCFRSELQFMEELSKSR